MASLKDIDDYVEKLTDKAETDINTTQPISIKELTNLDITGSLGVWGITQV